MPAAPVPRWGTVTVGGGRFRLMTAGEGDPLLFLHGWGLSPRAYAGGLVRLCGAGLRVVAPALPGFGGSTPPPLRELGLAAYAGRVAALLDDLDLDPPPFVVGHSFGGGVALQLAHDRPDLVRSLTLVNPVGGAPARRSEGRPLADRSWLRWALRAAAELDPRDVLRIAPDLLRDFLPNLVQSPLTTAVTGAVALRATLADEAGAVVAGGTPVLLVWSDRDRLVAPGQLPEVVGQLATEVVGGRHGWLLTRPAEFADLLHNALVVHAMLERRRRGQAVVLPPGTSLADLLPAERRHRSRPDTDAPPEPRAAGRPAG